MIWFAAIAQRRCVKATYNDVTVLLAPHVLYLRGDQPYVAAVAVERRGLPVRERRLGIFAVAGLRHCASTARGFSPDPSYSPADPRFAATSLLGVEA